MATDPGDGRRRLTGWLAAGALALAASAAGMGLALRLSGGVRSASVEVEVRPAGAEVRLDGRFAGTAPLRLAGLNAGTHVVEAVMAGHRLAARRLELGPGQRASLDIELEALPSGALEVTSDAPGAEVTLDGQARGPAPLTVTGLAPGRHRLTVQRSRFAPWNAAVEVAPGKTATVAARLEDTARRFMESAAAENPKDMQIRGELFAYLVAVRDLPAAAACLASGALESEWGAGGARSEDELARAEILGRHYFKQSESLEAERAEGLRAALAERVGRLAAEDGAKAGTVLDFLVGVARRTARERPDRPRTVDGIVLAAARKAPGCIPVLERGLDAAARCQEAKAAAELLASAAGTKPGDREHAGAVALAGLNRARLGSPSPEVRAQVLAAASAITEKALAGDWAPDQVVLRARLRRLHGRLLLLSGSAEQALAEQERALADLAPLKAEQAALFWPWRVERARMLIDMKRTEDARVELAEIAGKSPEGPWREEARTEMNRLPAPAPSPAPAPAPGN